MKEIIIIPHIGIGQLKLGMAPDELENALLQMKKQWSNSSDEAMQMECCAETDDPNLITGRYMDNDSFFLVQYRNGKAAEIGIQRDLSKVASIKLFGLDVTLCSSMYKPPPMIPLRHKLHTKVFPIILPPPIS